MRLFFKQILLATLLSCIALSVWAEEGSEGPGSGGGGGVIGVESKYYLIDFLNIVTLEQLIEISQTSGDVQTKATQPFTLVRNRKAPISSFNRAQEIFEQWEKLPFNFSTPLMRLMFFGSLRWQFVDVIEKNARYFEPVHLKQDAKVKTAAYYKRYGRGNFAIQIERPVWNQMSELNQTGLVIHEGLRNLQFLEYEHFDDEALQKATAILVLCKPSIKLSQYIWHLISNQPALAESRMGSFESVTSQCTGLEQ